MKSLRKGSHGDSSLRGIRDEMDRVLAKLVPVALRHSRPRDELFNNGQITLCRSVVNGLPVAVVLLPEETQRPLTKRQEQVVSLLGRGIGNAGIAKELRVSKETVKTHLKNISQRWDLHTRAALVRCSAVL